MILYHPAKDSNHCLYRMLSVLVNVKVEITSEKLRLLDFYFVFPHLLKEIKPWPSEIKEFKKLVSNVPPPFEKIPNKKRLFFDMADTQRHSISMLHAIGLIQDENYRRGQIRVLDGAVPGELLELIQSDPFIKSDVFRTIVEGLPFALWEGRQGLKYRTGLLEYKYDE